MRGENIDGGCCQFSRQKRCYDKPQRLAVQPVSVIFMLNHDLSMVLPNFAPAFRCSQIRTVDSEVGVHVLDVSLASCRPCPESLLEGGR
jgi:hypothetical protein